MKQMRNQSGAMVLEIGLVLITIAALGFAFYTVSKTRSDAGKQVALHNAKSKPGADPYQGWQTFSSSINHLSFKYPADWKSDIKLTGEGDYRSETGSITSPAGFVLTIINNPDGLGGACDNEDKSSDNACPLVETYSVAPVTITGAPDTFIVKQYFLNVKDRSDEGKKVIGLYTRTATNKDYSQFLTTKEIFGYPPYLIVADPTAGVANSAWVHGEYPSTDSKSNLSPKDYYSQPEVKTAELILASFKLK